MRAKLTAIAAFCLFIALSPTSVRAQSSDILQLSLKREFGRAEFRECTLDLAFGEAGGRAGLHCVRLFIRSQTPQHPRHERTMTKEEANRLLRLAHDSDLLSGGHIGSDGTSADGVLETVTVTQSGRTAILVTSDNPTFTTGSRRELLDLLSAIFDEMMKKAK